MKKTEKYQKLYDRITKELEEYLPELTLEEYKLIAKKHHKPWDVTGGYHPELYLKLVHIPTEPNWEGDQEEM